MAATNFDLLGLGVSAGLIAHAGGGQANALQLTEAWNEIVTVATAADSVKLPPTGPSTANNVGPGVSISVTNAGANGLQVFATAPDTINGVATGTGIALPAGKTGIYWTSAAGKWYGGYLT